MDIEVLRSIERVEYDFINHPSVSNSTTSSQNTLSNFLPNFIEFMKEMSSNITNCHRITDNSTKIEYKAPILKYVRTMGYNHYIIEKNSRGNYEMYQETNGNGGKQFCTSKSEFPGDQSIDDYNEIFQTLAMGLMTNQMYLKITTSGF